MNATSAITLLIPALLAAQPPARLQTQSDDYTRYELLAPGSGKFRILYEVTATTAGMTEFYNPIRKGSVASDEHVSDRATGKPLPFETVNGFTARAGGVRNADTTGDYIRVKLSRPVPVEGEQRVLIDKTYLDTKSFYIDSTGMIVFSRPLGIKRNAVVLPSGYELVSVNWPSQILTENDGRIAVSFWNNTPAEAPVTIRARRSATRMTPVALDSATRRSTAGRLDERAHQNRKIVYYLQQPETHSFDLYHDYTESRAGVSTYLNVVRTGSTVSKPRARNLDTGEELKWDIQRGDSVIVIFHFPEVKAGESIRLRMYETYTDTARYKIVGDQLYWDRSFGRPANAVVLPSGWQLTNSSIPASVSELADGRTRLDFINPRPDEVAVLITARRRSTAP